MFKHEITLSKALGFVIHLHESQVSQRVFLCLFPRWEVPMDSKGRCLPGTGTNCPADFAAWP